MKRLFTRRALLRGAGYALMGWIAARWSELRAEELTPRVYLPGVVGGAYPSVTMTPYPTATSTFVSPTATPTGVSPTATPTSSPSPTLTLTTTPSATPSATATPSPTATPTPTPTITPTLTSTPIRRERVVHIHAAAATHWDYRTGWYGDAVEQAVLDEMVAQGVQRLTSAATPDAAWRALLPAYRAGQIIAVKVNLNNATCNDADNIIDALMSVVNALLGSLVGAGVQEEDIWVYDAVRSLPTRFYGRRRHLRAHYMGTACGDATPTFQHIDPSLRVAFSNEAMARERWLPDLLYRASYLINLPILKRHGIHPVTLGFKNHYGSLSDLRDYGNDSPHVYIRPTDSRYSAAWSPLVDINANPNIREKTVLTLADGLYGASGVNATPTPWRTFGQQAPNSLFFSRDPVAMDCVLCDHLRAEWGLNEAAYDYLRVAEARGLGVFERGDPWGSGYGRLEYEKVEL